MEPTRHEVIEIKLHLPVDTPIQYRLIAKDVCNVLCTEDDDLTFTYNFNIDYFGRTAERFKKILILAKAGYITYTNISCLNHKIFLLQEVLKELATLEDKQC